MNKLYSKYLKSLVIICIYSFSTLVSAVSLDKIVVFGDSLSDTGNLYEYMKHQLPLSPPYYQGRFSNGPIWVEVLSNFYYPEYANQHLLNYAFGGAGVLSEEDDDDELFTLRREVDTYFLATHNKADAKALYTIWIGSNNYLALPDKPDQSIKQVSYGIEKELKKLVANGAKHILLINLPDLGTTPAARDFEAIELLSYLTQQHNSALLKLYNDYKSKYPEIEWLYYDIYKDMQEMMYDPVHHGFSNVTGTCYEQLEQESKRKSILGIVANLNYVNKSSACDGYLFFDPVHPAAHAHELIAERIKFLFEDKRIDFR